MPAQDFQGLAPPAWWKTPWARYGSAVATFAVSLLLRFALDPWMPGDRMFILFVPAVVITTFVSGVVPGLVTATLSGLAIWYFFLPHYGSFGLNIDGSIGLATYIVVMGSILALLNWLKGTLAQLQIEKANSQALAERERMLAREVRHRTKNLLAVVSGIADRTLQGDVTLQEAKEALIGRLEALGHADRRLVDPGKEETTLAALVEAELEAFAGRFEATGRDVILGHRIAQSFALVLHELATNASKYGALSNKTGRIALAWAEQDDRLRFTWREIGGPKVEPPTRRGFGTSLIRSALGPASLRYDPGGLLYEVEVDLSADDGAG